MEKNELEKKIDSDHEEFCKAAAYQADQEIIMGMNPTCDFRAGTSHIHWNEPPFSIVSRAISNATQPYKDDLNDIGKVAMECLETAGILDEKLGKARIQRNEALIELQALLHCKCTAPCHHKADAKKRLAELKEEIENEKD